MKAYGLPLMLLFLFLVVPLVSAGNLSMVVQSDPYYQQGASNQNFIITTFSSTGALVTNNLLTCNSVMTLADGTSYTLANSAGVTTYSIFAIYSSRLGVLGGFTFTAYCTSAAGESGFVTQQAYVTENGEPLENNIAMLIAIMFVPLIIALLFIIGAAVLSDKHSILRMVSYLLVLPFSWLSFHFGTLGIVKTMNYPELQIVVGDSVYWTGWLFFVLVFYFIIYLIFVAFNRAAQKKKAELEY